MTFDNNLYSKLIYLRANIKNRDRYKQGRAPVVCTDDALYEIAKLTPRKKEDLVSVTGIGTSFIENYADEFLNTINSHVKDDKVDCTEISPPIHHTMRELEKKLVKINRRNRLLYMPKIYRKYAYDLYDEEGRIDIQKLIYSNSKVKVCDINNLSQIKGQSGEEKYKRLSALLREVEKDFRDKGQFDLYMGYPFVSGRLAGENFDIRAPLVLFPVEYTKEANYISIKNDKTKDIVHNSNLILPHYKYNRINRPLPDCILDEIDRGSFINDIISFYKKEGIELKESDKSHNKFIDYKSGEFPQYRNGEFHIEHNIVLGKFPTYASSLQKDFNQIIDEGLINKLLESLLSGLGNDDFYSDYYAGDAEIDDSTEPLTISEHQLSYVGDLNSSQENVITAIKRQPALVVQGPPGTGKSQTITSLIADFACNEKNVLMIAEKKTALDVVYSRLGDLNKYTILIHDLNDKKDFYSQMENIVDIWHSISINKNTIRSVSNNIDRYVKTLEEIAQKIYSPNDFGIELYKLYLQSYRLDLSTSEGSHKYETYDNLTTDTIAQSNYTTLKNMNEKYMNASLVKSVDNYISTTSIAPWMKYVKDNLTEYEVFNFKKISKTTSEDINVWRNKNALVRLFTKGKLTRKIGEQIGEYFGDYNKDIVKLILDKGFYDSALNNYDEFIVSKPVFDSLNDLEKEYYKITKSISSLYCDNFDKANNELLNFLICKNIYNFESENRTILSNLDSFPNIIHELSAEIQKKKELTKQHLESILFDNLKENITYCKRQGEIQRRIESKRKWSISKFMHTFEFEMFHGIKIWLMTPEVASEVLPLEPGLFDLVIFDEASQMYVEKGIPAIHRAKKVVIAGDSKQLRPSSLGSGRVEMDENWTEDDEINAALEEESLLDVARFKYVPPVTLNYHYRSQYEELIAFSNYAFYKANLYISPNVMPAEKAPIEVVKIDNGVWAKRSNYNEARKVIYLLQKFFKERKNNETIGIITFNSNQRDLIEELIDEQRAKDQEFNTIIKNEIARKKDGEDIGLFVNNIERVQGDERDVIMFSLGYAKNESGRLATQFGWLNQKGGENRLNVAISRAKKKIYIVTSFEPHELHVENTKNNGPKYLKKYLEYAFAVSNKNYEFAQQILLSLNDNSNRNSNLQFDSDFENQVYDALVARGYQVDTQIGIGGYSIDLAIKQGDRYIVGIECDGKLYHSSKSARERDYHRQKYLESRGWIIHRIWSTKWWRNSETEIDKIERLVESLKTKVG